MTDSTHRYLSDHVRISVEHRDLRMRDERGRKIGAQITVSEATVVLSEWTYWAKLDVYELGTKIRELRVHATRNGKLYGAGPRAFLAGASDDPQTEKRIKVEIRRRIAGMRRRYKAKAEARAKAAASKPSNYDPDAPCRHCTDGSCMLCQMQVPESPFASSSYGRLVSDQPRRTSGRKTPP